ncbi:MAG: Mrp/NBP35 family ATP-binding protein [Pseudomonadota bacterium]
MSEKCQSCSGTGCSVKERHTTENDRDFEMRQRLCQRMCVVRHKVIVMSGKGGVGKSTVAVNIASALRRNGKRVGLLDADLHGPSIPRLVGLEGHEAEVRDGALIPLETAGGLKVMSIGFLLGQDPETAVIWRGPVKIGVIRQFLSDVAWGELDYLIIDCPPGTGDEPMTLVQLLEGADGGVVVTTPQEVAISDVRRSVAFCRKVGLNVLGIVENMSGFVCPDCGKRVDIFRSGGGRRLAQTMGVPFLGAIPIDPDVTLASDAGRPYVELNADSAAAKAFEEVIQPILKLDDATKTKMGSA